jgi:hypothetical protein
VAKKKPKGEGPKRPQQRATQSEDIAEILESAAEGQKPLPADAVEVADDWPVKFADQDPNYDWRALMLRIRDLRGLTDKLLVPFILGELNPNQVATSIASNKDLPNAEEGERVSGVIAWLRSQVGSCSICGTTLDLQVDHETPRQDIIEGRATVADVANPANYRLRCRRHNSSRRHKRGGLTHLTTQSALMWLLFEFLPRTPFDFARLGRLYGLSMFAPRFAEAWTMAHWLRTSRQFDFEDSADLSDILSHLLLWPDGAMTRRRPEDLRQTGARQSNVMVSSRNHLIVIATADRKATAFRLPIITVPYSHYFSGRKVTVSVGAVSRDLTPPDLCFNYPSRKKGMGVPPFPTWKPSPPRGFEVIQVYEVPSTADATITLAKRQRVFAPGKRRGALGKGPASTVEVAVSGQTIHPLAFA